MQFLLSVAYKNEKICIYAVNNVTERYLRDTYVNLQFFLNFFLRVLFKMEYEDIVDIVCKECRDSLY